MRTFGKENRSYQEIKENQVDINALLGLNNHTMCIQTFPDPFITCCFVSDTKIFINLFHNATLTHYHFLYDIEVREVVGDVVKRVLDSTKKNFPYNCFYNDERNEIYSFYRQGQSFIINAEDMENYEFDRMTEKDLGQMYLVFNTALVARSSSDILFFKIEKNIDTEKREWKLPYRISARLHLLHQRKCADLNRV